LLQKNVYKNKKIKNSNNNKGNEQEDNNKQQDNANPTTREMNTIQVDCCKKCSQKQKKSRNPTNK
jgi:hypothetical protein